MHLPWSIWLLLIVSPICTILNANAVVRQFFDTCMVDTDRSIVVNVTMATISIVFHMSVLVFPLVAPLAIMYVILCAMESNMRVNAAANAE